MSKQVTARIADELVERFDRLAERTGESRSSLVEEAMGKSIDEMEQDWGEKINPLARYGFPDEVITKIRDKAGIRTDAVVLGCAFGGMRFVGDNPGDFLVVPRSGIEGCDKDKIMLVYEGDSSKADYMDVWSSFAGSRSGIGSNDKSVSDDLRSFDVRLRILEKNGDRRFCFALYNKGDVAKHGLDSFLAVLDPVKWEQVDAEEL